MQLPTGKHLLIRLLPLAVIAAAAGWWLLRDSDEAEIRAQITELTQLVSKPAGEAPAAGLMKLAGAKKIFAPLTDFDLRHEKYRATLPVKEIPSRIAAWRNRVTVAKIGAEDLEFVSLAPPDASLHFTGTLEGTLSGSGKRISEVREVEARLIKTPDGWRISSLTIRDILER